MQQSRIRHFASSLPIIYSVVAIISSLVALRSDAFGQHNFSLVALKSEAAYALQHYLDLDCSASGPRAKWSLGAFERLLLSAEEVPDIEDGLIGFLTSGQDKDHSDAMRKILEEEWSELKIFLDEKPELGLPPHDMALLERMMQKKEAYIERGLARKKKMYQERSAIALEALGARGSEKAKKAIRTIMETGSNDSKAAIMKARQDFSALSLSRGR
jgi:hypothetical protein